MIILFILFLDVPNLLAQHSNSQVESLLPRLTLANLTNLDRTNRDLANLTPANLCYQRRTLALDPARTRTGRRDPDADAGPRKLWRRTPHCSTG